ncbi:MAG: hypothetical protein GY847_15910 [Proteobacteria bacterium]|nr:hypothetical protein [Pseudomonadota bacterium]
MSIHSLHLPDERAKQSDVRSADLLAYRGDAGSGFLSDMLVVAMGPNGVE